MIQILDIFRVNLINWTIVTVTRKKKKKDAELDKSGTQENRSKSIAWGGQQAMASFDMTVSVANNSAFTRHDKARGPVGYGAQTRHAAKAKGEEKLG